MGRRIEVEDCEVGVREDRVPLASTWEPVIREYQAWLWALKSHMMMYLFTELKSG